MAEKDRLELQIATPADISGAEKTTAAVEAITPAAEKASESLESVAESSAKVQPPDTSDWFREVIDQASAARREVESFEERVRGLTAPELDVVAEQYRTARDAAREAGEATEEYDAKLAAVTAAQDAATDAKIEANAAIAQENSSLLDNVAATAQVVGTVKQFSDSSREAKGMVDGMASGIKAGTGAIKNFERATHGGTQGVRGLIGMLRLMASGALLNPWTYLVGAVVLLGKRMWDVHSAIQKVHEEIKQTEADGLVRMQDRMVVVAEEAKKMATDSFVKAKDNAKAIADQWQRSLEYSRELQRIADEKDNAQMAYDISKVDQAEADGSMTGSDAIAERAKIRQSYAGAKARRDEAAKQNKIDANSGTLQGSAAELERMKAEALATVEKLQQLRDEQSKAAAADDVAKRSNWLLNDDQKLPENSAATFDVAISRQASLSKEQTVELEKMQKEHDALVLKIQGENNLLADQIKHIKEIANLNKLTEANRAGVEISGRQKQEIDKAGADQTQSRKDLESLTPAEQLQQVLGPKIAPYTKEGSSILGHVSRGIQTSINGLKDGDQGGEMQELLRQVMELQRLSLGLHTTTKADVEATNAEIKRIAAALQQLDSRTKTSPAQ